MFKKVRFSVLAFLIVASFINYIDRAALSIAAPMVSKEFNLGPADLGMIFSGFFVGYCVFNFVGGYFSDVYGPRKALAWAMAAWSLFSGLTIGAWNFTSLFVVRILFGIGEGPIASGSNKMVNNWFPAQERARAMGASIGGMPLGAAIAGPIVGFLMIAYGWRVAFVILTVLGFLWTIFWLKMTTDHPEDHPAISAEELQYIKSGQVKASDTSVAVPLMFFLKQPTILAIILAFFACNYIIYFFLSWFPMYLVMAHHTSIKDMAILTIIPWFVAFVGNVGGGFIQDYIYKRVGNLIRARKLHIVSFLLASAVSIGLCGYSTNVYWAVGLMSLGVFFMYATLCNYWAVVQDTVRSESVGSVGGLVHFISNTSGIIGPSVTGFIVQGYGSFALAFLLTAALTVAGALAVAFFVKPITVK
jgi:MFS transporter, ACS family, hexuronate transporter